VGKQPDVLEQGGGACASVEGRDLGEIGARQCSVQGNGDGGATWKDEGISISIRIGINESAIDIDVDITSAESGGGACARNTKR
jgi:hypothetical protein